MNITTKIEFGKSYFWYNHSKSIIVLIPKVAHPDGSIEFIWQLYIGFQSKEDPTEGNITWTQKEIDSAIKDAKLAEFQPKPGLEEDEEYCHVCNGSYFECTRDSEVLPCIWCKDGKRKKLTEEQLKPKKIRRSNLHPEVDNE